MSYDLILQREDGSRDLALSEQLTQALAELSPMDLCEVHSSYGKPGADDVFSLADLLEDDPEAQERFASFCAERGIDASEAFDVDAGSGDPAIAAAFIDKEWGANLVSVVMPKTKVEADVVEAYATVVEFARLRKLVVHDPQLGENIDLSQPGVLPPRWG